MARPQLEVFTQEEAIDPEVIVTDMAQMDELRQSALNEGFTQGYAAAQEAAREQETHAQTEIFALLNKLDQNHAEIKTQLTQEFARLLLGMCEKILPRMAAASLAPHITEALQQLLRDSLNKSVKVAVHPQNIAQVSAWLAASEGLIWQLEPEPTLPLGAARLQADDGNYHLDLDRCAEEIVQVLHDYFAQILESDHG